MVLDTRLGVLDTPCSVLDTRACVLDTLRGVSNTPGMVFGEASSASPVVVTGAQVTPACVLDALARVLDTLHYLLDTLHRVIKTLASVLNNSLQGLVVMVFGPVSVYSGSPVRRARDLSLLSTLGCC